MSNGKEYGKEYDVGYAKPPPASRFKPGQSGHPTGRPKGAIGFKSALKRAIEANGMTPSQFMVDALKDEVRKALDGSDPKSRDRILKWAEKHLGDDEPEASL